MRYCLIFIIIHDSIRHFIYGHCHRVFSSLLSKKSETKNYDEHTRALASERLQRIEEKERKTNDLHIKMTMINMEVVNPFTEYYSPTSARNSQLSDCVRKIQFRWESIEIHRSIEQIQRIHNIQQIGIQPIHIKWLSIVIKTNVFLFLMRFTQAQFEKMFSAHRDLWNGQGEEKKS